MPAMKEPQPKITKPCNYKPGTPGYRVVGAVRITGGFLIPLETGGYRVLPDSTEPCSHASHNQNPEPHGHTNARNENKALTSQCELDLAPKRSGLPTSVVEFQFEFPTHTSKKPSHPSHPKTEDVT